MRRNIPHKEPLSSQGQDLHSLQEERIFPVNMPGWEPQDNIAQLQVRALQTDANTIRVDTNLSMVEAPTSLT